MSSMQKKLIASKMKYILSTIIIYIVLICNTVFSSEINVKHCNYSIPVTDVVANAITLASKELDIDLYEFFYLSSCPLHSRGTVKLNKDNDRVWRLEFVSLPENSYLVFLWLCRTQDSRISLAKEKPLNSRDLAEVLKKQIKSNDSFDVDLKKLRRVDTLHKEISEKVWSGNGDGKERIIWGQ